MPTGRGRRKSFKSELELEALGAPIEVRRHPAAGRLTLRVSKTKRAVIITVPAQCQMEEAGRFVKSNLDWVRDRLGRVPAPVPFVDGAKVPLRGRLHCVCFLGAGRAKSVVEVADAQGGMPRLLVSGRLEHASRRVADLLVEERRAGLDRVARAHAV